MYYIIGIALSLTAIVSGWNDNPITVMLGGIYLGHALTEILNDPT